MYVFPSYVTKIDRSPATTLPNCSSTGSTGKVRSGVALAAVDIASGVLSSGDCGISVAGAAAGAAAGAGVDDAFAEPEPVKLSSEQMASGTVAIATAAGVNVDALAGGKPSDAIPDAPPPAVGLPPQTQRPAPWAVLQA